MKKFLLIAAATAALLTAAPAAAQTTDPTEGPATVAPTIEQPSAANSDMPIAGYLLNNEFRRVWMDDGVKGIVKNFTQHSIWVRDTTMDKRVQVAPGMAVVFYSDRDLTRFGNLSEGDGTWLEIGRTGHTAVVSEFRLCDPTFGRPDTYFKGPGVINQRESWKEGDSHHELTSTHKFWVKRESDSWKQKYDTWNSSDWPAFSIHVDGI